MGAQWVRWLISYELEPSHASYSPADVSVPTLLKSSTRTHQKGTRADKGTWVDVLCNDGSYEPFILQKRDTLEKGFDNILCEANKQTGSSPAWYLITLSFKKNEGKKKYL